MNNQKGFEMLKETKKKTAKKIMITKPKKKVSKRKNPDKNPLKFELLRYMQMKISNIISMTEDEQPVGVVEFLKFEESFINQFHDPDLKFFGLEQLNYISAITKDLMSIIKKS